MKTTPNIPLTDEELHALADGQGAPAVMAALQVKLAADPVGQARLTQWQLQRNALRGLYAEVLNEPVPPALAQAAVKAGAAREATSQWWRYGGMAAGVVMAFGAGWMANSGWQQSRADWPTAPKFARAQAENNFVRQASVAHSVYAPEIRHPVEVSALEQVHLVQWLSKRLGKPLKVPDLSAQGFELVGGRLLPGDTGARAQFMFQNAAGSRVTLYLGALAAPVGTELSSKETSFRFEPQAGVPSFYWVDQGFGYALAGQLPRQSLMSLAQAVYQQL